MTEENLEQNELIEEVNSAELLEPEVDPIPEIDSKYRLILLAAQRSKQLQKGATPRVNADVRRTKSTRIALEEFKQKKIHFEFTEL